MVEIGEPHDAASLRACVQVDNPNVDVHLIDPTQEEPSPLDISVLLENARRIIDATPSEHVRRYLHTDYHFGAPHTVAEEEVDVPNTAPGSLLLVTHRLYTAEEEMASGYSPEQGVFFVGQDSDNHIVFVAATRYQDAPVSVRKGYARKDTGCVLRAVHERGPSEKEPITVYALREGTQPYVPNVPFGVWESPPRSQEVISVGRPALPAQRQREIADSFGIKNRR